ncbi:hypothetical protein TrRE_jg13296 [Triparma retinervis]|uniref:Acetyl-CoA acetyltransferase n=1 Tax=Triparma retinervis TaxID=2557542 RepID=A0A9W7E0N9_9STRA|nr:hypothetical protein TrRE_jg13296 [Triparma retinervis]
MSALPRPVIVSFARTAIAPFNGSLSSISAPALASSTISHQLASLSASSTFKAADIVDVTLGNVVSAGVGQAPARQAWKGAGGQDAAQCTTVNKVCASGMKAAMYACQNIQLGSGPQLAGGFESMSNIPHYLPSLRTGVKLGPSTLLDGVVHDGLWDVYNNQHMGMCGEKCAEDYGITREDQDNFAIESYRRANEAIEKGLFKGEIAPVEVKTRKGVNVVDGDDEPGNFDVSKMTKLRPAFKRDESGTVTAANASSLNDGAASMVIMSEDQADAFGLKLMNLDPSKVNVNGGAVALGHPIGCSGARIIGTLISVLNQNDAQYGCASICNGGGGASAFVIEKM